MYDTSDEAQVNDQALKLKFGTRRQEDALRKLLSMVEGREWMWRILSSANVFSSVSDRDPMTMALRSGRRDLGLEIFRDINLADPEAFRRMQKEAENGDYND